MLTDDEITQKVEALRNGLRQSRQTGGNPESDSSSTDTTKRRTGEKLSGRTRRNASRTPGNATGTGKPDDNQRRTNPFFDGIGSTQRRPDESNGVPDAARSDAQGTPARRIVKDDDITEKRPIIPPTIPPFKPRRGPGRPKTETSPQTSGVQVDSDVKRPTRNTFINSLSAKAKDIKPPAFNWFKSGNTLNETEAEHFLEPLTKAYLDYGEYLDQFINTKAARSDAFFGDLTFDEAQVLARITIKAGRRNSSFATVVRTASEGNDYLSAIVIMLPRIKKVVEALREEIPDVRNQTIEQTAKKAVMGGIFNNARR